MPSLTHTRKELANTWQHFGYLQPPRLLRDAWPKVLPQPGGLLDSTEDSSPRPSATRGGTTPASSTYAWVTALVAFDELQSYRDQDTLTRRAVELLRDAVKLERAAVFLLHDNITLQGTFGTSLHGETTDERHIAFELGQSHREAFALASQGLAQWSRFPNVPLFAQQANQTVVVRTGENVIVPILAAGECLGLIACDNGFSGTGVDTETLIRTAVLARILGSCLAPWSKASSVSNTADHDTRGVNVTKAQCSELIGAAIRRLRLDPNEPRERLAKALGTTADRLGRAFKAEMAESLPEYRNKLRLQRFLSLVDPNGGDLLACALAAGFGSYAQFHRVFHQCYGVSPIAYLRQRDGSLATAKS